MVVREGELQQIIDAIIHGAHPDRIYLFGSQTRKGGRTGGDIDLLVVMNTTDPHRVRCAKLSSLIPERQVALDFIVNTPQEFEARRSIPNTIQRTVAEQGVLLYERSA